MCLKKTGFERTSYKKSGEKGKKMRKTEKREEQRRDEEGNERLESGMRKTETQIRTAHKVPVASYL
jgi:hypothetical protein